MHQANWQTCQVQSSFHLYIARKAARRHISWSGQHAQAPLGRQGLGTAHISCSAATPCASCRLDMHLRLVSGSGSADASEKHLNGVRLQACAQSGGTIPESVPHNLRCSDRQRHRERCAQAQHLLLPGAPSPEDQSGVHKANYCGPCVHNINPLRDGNEKQFDTSCRSGDAANA
jgi:hypothetical protein